MRPLAKFLSIAVTVLTVWVSAVWAQGTMPPDYGDWRRVADRAAEAIDNDRASEAAMDTLRDQLSLWSEDFSSESSRSRISVITLEAQLKRLGPVPEGGEAEDVADERVGERRVQRRPRDCDGELVVLLVKMFVQERNLVL